MPKQDPAATQSVRPTRRNPLVTFLLPTLLLLAAPPLGNYLGQTMFRAAPFIALGLGGLVGLVLLMTMVAELNSVTGNHAVGWHYFIPLYGLYWAVTVLRKEMAIAKEQAKRPPPRSAAIYVFFCLYALAADLNDLS